ncbi:MAG: hypothetical protein ACLQPH_22450 [Acidimicrobiales bacterium]
MMHPLLTVPRLLVGMVAVGTLSLGLAGTAGAGSAVPLTAPKVTSSFNCARATKVLTRIQRGEARIATGLPGLTKVEARAREHGHPKYAAFLQRQIARFESAPFKARLTRVSSAIDAKCHVSAPSPSTSS